MRSRPGQSYDRHKSSKKFYPVVRRSALHIYTYLIGTLKCLEYYKMIDVYASQCSTSFAGLEGKSSSSFRVSGLQGHDSRESSLLYFTLVLVSICNKNGSW